jgi:hypothetical protein
MDGGAERKAIIEGQGRNLITLILLEFLVRWLSDKTPHFVRWFCPIVYRTVYRTVIGQRISLIHLKTGS